MSSVSCVASTAPCPGRAWSEWPWVITARSTGRVGSMWKPPGLQHRPAATGIRISCGCILIIDRPTGASFEARLQQRKISSEMPARLFLTSGDLVADRRYEFARDLQLRGDLAAAADLLEQAIELAPKFVSAWFTLGEIRQQLGERDAAVA